MAENFAAFDYKTLEEVLTVIKYLTNVLSTTGMQVLELISPSHLLAQLHEPVPMVVDSVEPSTASVVRKVHLLISDILIDHSNVG